MTTSLNSNGEGIAADLTRYSRQILTSVGVAGQRRLNNARVLIAGVGGLGSPAALYLAGAGVGVIGLVDDDVVATHNLHRQIIYRTADVGRPKIEVAQTALQALNPHVRVPLHPVRARPDNVRALISDYDLVIDGTDQFAARYALHDECFAQGKPYVYGALHALEGQLSVFVRGAGPCYRCLYPRPPRDEPTSCDEHGVLGTLPGTVGTLLATEAIKLILNNSSARTLAGRLLLYDAWELSFQELKIPKRADCSLCAEELVDVPRFLNVNVSEVSEADRTHADRITPSDQLLDVRELRESLTANVPGAVRIPVAELFARAPQELDRRKPVVVFCRRLARARRAAFLLAQLGFNDVRVFEAGPARLIEMASA